VELQWDVPAGCPSAARVSERIRKLAGPIKTSSTPLRAEATITRRDDGKLHLHLVIHAGDAVGARDVDAKSCDDLGGVAAVALALLLRSPDPLVAKDLSAVPEDVTPSEGGGPGNTTESTSTPENTNQPGGTTAPSQPNAPSTPPQSEPDSRARTGESRASRLDWHLLLRAPVGALAIGPLPNASLGVMLGVGVRLSRWSILAEGALWSTQSDSLADSPGASAELERKSARLDFCYSIGSPRWQIAPCALLGLEHISARGSGSYVAAQSASTTWIAPGLGLASGLEIASWLELVATAAAQIETARPEILVQPTVGYEAVTPGASKLAPMSVTITVGPQFIW